MNSATINKYNKKSYAVLHKRAVYYFNRFIRLRDTDDYGYGNCISSGQPLRFGSENCQAGHWFPAGHFKVLEFNEDNVNLQGLSDNYHKSGAGPMYRINLVKKIGSERVEALELLVQIEKAGGVGYKNDRFLMIEIIEKYSKKCKQEGKSKMFKV